MGCAGCKHLKVISVPDWFKCMADGRGAPTQTELYRHCVLRCPHNNTLYPGSNICADCGGVIDQE